MRFLRFFAYFAFRIANFEISKDVSFVCTANTVYPLYSTLLYLVDVNCFNDNNDTSGINGFNEKERGGLSRPFCLHIYVMITERG